jgi:fatty-acyl-CoA synthase
VLETVDTAFGVPFLHPYGLSEANAFVLLNHFEDPIDLRCQPGGTSLAGLEVRLAIGEAGPVGDESPGEILVRGASVMPGYMNDSEASRGAIDPDGWLHTGDLGCQVGDRIYFAGRLKDLLKVKGFNVSPREVEEVLDAHPAVAVAQVVGADGNDGEVPVAFVSAVKGTAAPTEADLLAWCRNRLASFKTPRRVVVVDAFPVTEGPQGNKIQRRRLRELAAELLSEAPPAADTLPSRRVLP